METPTLCQKRTTELWDALVRKGVLVRSFHRMGGRLATRLRMTIGTSAENDALLDALETWRTA